MGAYWAYYLYANYIRKKATLFMVHIFTDSAANLPLTLAKAHGITVIPFPYTVNGKPMLSTGEEFDGKAYYDAMRAGAQIKTSMINAAVFTEHFEAALKQGEDVLYIGISGAVSGTAAAAAMAVQELQEQYPQRSLDTIDSLGASLGEGMLVLEAVKLQKRGHTLHEIATAIRQLVPQMCQCFTVDDLRYLKQSGRISSATALVGSLLNIRPLLIGNTKGEIVMLNKIRGAKQALEALAEQYGKLVIDKAKAIGIAHADNENGMKYLLDCLKKKGFTGNVLSVPYEPMSGSHVGPGAIALFFLGQHRPG